MSPRQHPALRLRGRGSLAVAATAALSALAAFAQSGSAQEGCVFGDEGNDLFLQRTIPGRGAVTYVTRPHFVCEDGVQIWADSAVAYQADRLSHLIGSVRYVDRARELRANEARYFSDVARLQAQGDVRVIDREDGSVIENGDLVYLRVTDYREEEVLTVSTGRDGVRPRATLTRDSGEPGGEPAAPYVVQGDRITLRGANSFTSAGEVVIERDSLLAFADSADFDEASELLVLVGSARVEGTSYDLVGRTIEIAEAEQGTSEVRALRDALLTGEDLRLTAPQIRLYLLDGALQRLVAVPIREEEGVGGGVGEPEEADLARPVALAEELELTADSLELIAPDGEVERIFAVGGARSVSHARDSLNVESLPEIARTDWLEGDTIVVTLARVAGSAADSAVASGAEERGEYEVEQVVARVNARSLYRLLPEDSTARAGVDPPAVHYVVGSEITIYMREGEIESMEVTGQTQGVHLEPLSRAPAGDVPAADSLPADTPGVQPAGPPAPAGDSVPAAGAPNAAPGLLGWTGPDGRSPLWRQAPQPGLARAQPIRSRRARSRPARGIAAPHPRPVARARP